MKQALINILLGFVIAGAIAPLIISMIKKIKAKQTILEYMDNHKAKEGTLTMGGIIFCLALVIVFIIFLDKYSTLSLIAVLVTLGYGCLGFLDDSIKIKFKQNLGLRAYQKVIGQVGISLIIGLYVYFSNIVGDGVIIPFINMEIHLGWLIVPFIMFVYLAVTNSVNLTDGLDGLAGSVSVVYLLGFMVLLYLYIIGLENGGTSIAITNEYRSILTLCGGFVGALLLFLLINVFPAKIFMGDVGSLAIGGFIASVAVFTRFYLIIPILGLMFVLSAVSDIIQVGYYKLTKKRIFLMAPLHHHFERKGMSETRITYMYSLITFLLCVGTIILSM